MSPKAQCLFCYKYMCLFLWPAPFWCMNVLELKFNPLRSACRSQEDGSVCVSVSPNGAPFRGQKNKKLKDFVYKKITIKNRKISISHICCYGPLTHDHLPNNNRLWKHWNNVVFGKQRFQPSSRHVLFCYNNFQQIHQQILLYLNKKNIKTKIYICLSFLHYISVIFLLNLKYIGPFWIKPPKTKHY